MSDNDPTEEEMDGVMEDHKAKFLANLMMLPSDQAQQMIADTTKAARLLAFVFTPDEVKSMLINRVKELAKAKAKVNKKKTK